MGPVIAHEYKRGLAYLYTDTGFSLLLISFVCVCEWNIYITSYLSLNLNTSTALASARNKYMAIEQVLDMLKNHNLYMFVWLHK